MMWFKIKYIYVIVRKDLPIHDQIIQVGHACHESGMRWKHRNTYLVLLEVNNEQLLIKWHNILKQNRIKHIMFQEPDPAEEIGAEPMNFTAICTAPISGQIRELFKDAKMWKF